LDADLRRLGWSKKEFAEKLHVAYEAVRKWEQFNQVPKKRQDEVANLLGRDSELVRLFWGAFPGGLTFMSAREPVARYSGTSYIPAKVVDEPLRPHLRDHTSEAAFRRALPARLQHDAGKRVLIGGLAREMDYLSDKVGLELISAPPTTTLSTLAARALVRLIVVKSALASEAPRDLLLVLVMGEAPVRAVSGLQTLAIDCTLLGVRFLVVETPEQAAQLVAKLENDEPIDDVNEF
jgi:hypothetical protein